MSDWSDDDDSPKRDAGGRSIREWECPSCNAHNPTDEKVPPKGVELRCNYCGVEFRLTFTDEGRLRFKEL